MVKCVKKNLNTTNKFCQTLGPSLNRGSIVPAFITSHEGVWGGGVKLSSKVGKQNTEFFKQDQELQVTFNIIYVPKNDFFLLIFPNIRIEVAS